jgi:hypothetical protein
LPGHGADLSIADQNGMDYYQVLDDYRVELPEWFPARGADTL